MKAYRDEITGRWHTDLPDVFDLICQKLRDKEPFSFSRWGDGEWNAVYGKKGANCDGHEYFADMGERLRKIVASKPNYMMGLQPLTVASDRMKQIEQDFPGIDWVNADSIHNASIDGRMYELFEAIDIHGGDVVLVGPDHLGKLARDKGWSTVIIPDKNCWESYYQFMPNVTAAFFEMSGYFNYKHIFLLCASMVSEVIIDSCQHNESQTWIDIGSVFDPYCGVKSRRYHHKLNIDADL